MHTKNRQIFLQKDIHDIYKESTQREHNRDSKAQVEFAKSCQRNNGVPMPNVVNNRAGNYDGNFVIVDETLPEGQSFGISDAFKDLVFQVNQICLCNNNLTGASFARILSSLSQE